MTHGGVTVDMTVSFQKVKYSELNARQKEQYNFQKVSAILAEYGFQTIWLTADWESADFIAQHVDGETFLKIQLKGRLSFDKKYIGKNIWICFPKNNYCYLYPHDKLLELILSETNIDNTESWQVRGSYSFPSLTEIARRLLKPYRLDNEK